MKFYAHHGTFLKTFVQLIHRKVIKDIVVC